jgi:hypothetical protein
MTSEYQEECTHGFISIARIATRCMFIKKTKDKVLRAQGVATSPNAFLLIAGDQEEQ